MLLSKKKVWNIVNGDYPRSRELEDHTDEEIVKLSDTTKKKIETDIEEWDESNEDAFRIICFTVSDKLQASIHSGKTAKGAWDELQQVYAANDKQSKFSLLRCLYKLDMTGSLSDRKRTFDDLVQSQSAIGKNINADELIVLYANSLPVDTFGNWIQSQMAFIN